MAAKSTTPKKKSAGGAKDAGGRDRPAPSHPVLWASSIFFVVLCVVFRAIILGGQTFVSPDATAPLGFVRVGEQALKAGVYPLWNPYVFTGMPSFASGAYNPLIYPPDWPVGFVQRCCRCPTCRGCSSITSSPGSAPTSSRAPGARRRPPRSWPGSPSWPRRTWSPTARTATAARWSTRPTCRGSCGSPAALWQGGRWSDAAWLALLVGFQLLRGHVQIAYYGLLAIGLYSVFELVRRARREGGQSHRRAARSCSSRVALGLGLALSAFFSLPIREYAHWSIRGDAGAGGVSYDYATGWSLGPLETLTFLVPGALGFGGATYWGTMPFTDFPNYMGIAVLACAFLALAAGKRRFDATLPARARRARAARRLRASTARSTTSCSRTCRTSTSSACRS